MFKKNIIFVLIFLLIFTFLVRTAESLEITASSALLMDRDSGRILFEFNSREKRPMASTTKIMTAILALEMKEMQEVVKISSEAVSTEGSSIWLESGELKTVEELLYGLMLRSGNDAAVAIAEHIAGSVKDFALLMTKRARELGAVNTTFKNPHGLDEKDHLTTAYDLALLTRHTLFIPKFREIVKREDKRISWPGEPQPRMLHNQNKLLAIYPGGNGVKTGWTTPAGRCFVGSATRGGQQLISVVLDAPEMWEDSTALLDYGFENFKYYRFKEKNKPIKRVSLENGRQSSIEIEVERDFNFPLQKNEKKYLFFCFNINTPLSAPLSKGEVVGNLNVYLGKKLVAELQLVAGEDVERAGIYSIILQKLKTLFNRVSLVRD